MELFALDEARRLFLSPAIDNWSALEAAGISTVIDLEGGLDHGVPTRSNHLLYVYFPIEDAGLPDLARLHAVAALGAHLVTAEHTVLSHCGMGYNRSALVAGLILTYLGWSGADAVTLLRRKRPGALFNETFATYLQTCPMAKEYVNFSR